MIHGWRLFYPARPFTLNDRLHHHAKAKLNTEWRDAFTLMARAHKMPKGLDHITVIVRHHFTDQRYVPDCDNSAPAAKAAIDGLVAAGVITDDGPRWVGPVTYELPVLGPQAGLELIVIDEPAPELLHI